MQKELTHSASVLPLKDSSALGALVREGSVKPIQREPVSRTVGRPRIDFFVTTHNRIPAVDLANTSPEIADQLVQGFVLGFCGQIAIEIAHQADADRNIVQIVAMDVAAAELTNPAIPDFDLA